MEEKELKILAEALADLIAKQMADKVFQCFVESDLWKDAIKSSLQTKEEIKGETK